MAEVLLQFDSILTGPEGRGYTVRACGRVMDDGQRWEGWIEFVPDDGGTVQRTPRETVQHDREGTVYWATGLSEAYLEGALARALQPPPAVPVEPPPTESTYDGPAPPVVHAARQAPPQVPRAVLDPFHVYTQGEDILRKELGALEAVHLRNIIRTYDLVSPEEVDLQPMTRGALADLIIGAVRARV